MHKVPLRLLVAGVVCVGMLAMSPLPTLASLPWDGTNPHSTGCDVNAFNEFSMYIDQGTLQGRFGPACATAWAKFVCNDPNGQSCDGYCIEVVRYPATLTEKNCVTYFLDFTPNGDYIYTNQVYDGGSYIAKACYEADATHNNWVCTGWY